MQQLCQERNNSSSPPYISTHFINSYVEEEPYCKHQVKNIDTKASLIMKQKKDVAQSCILIDLLIKQRPENTVRKDLYFLRQQDKTGEVQANNKDSSRNSLNIAFTRAQARYCQPPVGKTCTTPEPARAFERLKTSPSCVWWSGNFGVGKHIVMFNIFSNKNTQTKI